MGAAIYQDARLAPFATLLLGIFLLFAGRILTSAREAPPRQPTTGSFGLWRARRSAWHVVSGVGWGLAAVGLYTVGGGVFLLSSGMIQAPLLFIGFGASCVSLGVGAVVAGRRALRRMAQPTQAESRT